jgi:hypothetical protein
MTQLYYELHFQSIGAREQVVLTTKKYLRKPTNDQKNNYIAHMESEGKRFAGIGIKDRVTDELLHFEFTNMKAYAKLTNGD